MSKESDSVQRDAETAKALFMTLFDSMNETQQRQILNFAELLLKYAPQASASG